MITVIYPLHNRLYYTQFSLPRVLDECKRSKRFERLFIVDDDSQDGSSEFITGLIERSGLADKVTYMKKQIGNSIDCINYATVKSKTKYFYKVDNDILIPIGCFDHLAAIMDKRSDIGFLGLLESDDFPYLNHEGKIDIVEHIGGVGIFRGVMFEGWIGNNDRYWGFTKFQQIMRKKGFMPAWYYGGKNTNLDRSTSYSRALEYARLGYSRDLSKPQKGSVFEPLKPKENGGK